MFQNSFILKSYPSRRYSTAGSTHTLNNYCDTSDNWTDHDMEIYMTRNATTRNGLVPLWEQLLRYRWYTDFLINYYNLNGIFWQPVHCSTEMVVNGSDSMLYASSTSAAAASKAANSTSTEHNTNSLNLCRRINLMQLIETNVYVRNPLGQIDTITTRSIEIYRKCNSANALSESYM